MAYQTGLIGLGSKELLSQLKFSPSGHLIAAASLDHSIRVSQRSTSESGWSEYASELKAHDGPVLSLAWAPAEWGKLIASGATDGTIKLWTIKKHQKNSSAAFKSPHAAPAGTPARLQLVATLTDARGTLRDLAFCPATLGLKLAAVASDSRLRVWECLDPVALNEWHIVEDIDLASLPNSPSSGAATAGAGLGLGALPNGGKQSETGSVQAASTAGGSSSASGGSFEGRRGGSVESEGGWALSWCGEGWWGERLAVSSGTNGLIRLFHLPPHAPWHNFLVLAPPKQANHANPPVITQSTGPIAERTPPTTSLAWAPASGRSYQLLAAGAKDGKARIWRVIPAALEGEEGPSEWSGMWDSELAANEHPQGAAQGATVVEWNLTGTVLSTTAVDGGVRLWKSVYAGPWKLLAKISTDEADEGAMQM